jgi:hypothetical protein
MGLNDPQPPSRPGAGAAIWDLVVEDIRARDAGGEKKYGRRLQAFNGRDCLVDAYQEALDLTVYLRQAIEERTQRTRHTEGEYQELARKAARLEADLTQLRERMPTEGSA